MTLSLSHVSGSGWDSGSVPKGLRPGGTQATYSETGQLLIDPQASSINVTALVGKQAVLGCFIRNINNHSVSLGQAARNKSNEMKYPNFVDKKICQKYKWQWLINDCSKSVSQSNEWWWRPAKHKSFTCFTNNRFRTLRSVKWIIHILLSRFFCCLRMILQKFDSFYTFWTGGIHDFQNQKMNASHDGSSHRQICSRLRYSQIIVYWSPGISVISVYSGVMDPAPGHQPPGSQQVRLHHQPQGQGDHHDELVMSWHAVS